MAEAAFLVPGPMNEQARIASEPEVDPAATEGGRGEGERGAARGVGIERNKREIKKGAQSEGDWAPLAATR